MRGLARFGGAPYLAAGIAACIVMTTIVLLAPSRFSTAIVMSVSLAGGVLTFDLVEQQPPGRALLDAVVAGAAIFLVLALAPKLGVPLWLVGVVSAGAIAYSVGRRRH